MNKLKGTLIVPIGMIIILLPVSLLIGWNLITLLLFWLIIIPVLAIYLPVLVSNKGKHLFESLVGLVIFYAIMIFMIYKQYKTDYFQVMIISGVINSVIVVLATSEKKSKVDTV